MTADGRYEIRDSKQTRTGCDQPTIFASHQSFSRLFDELLGQESAGSNSEIDVREHPGGDVTLRSPATGVELRYDAGEIAAFTAAIDEFIAVEAPVVSA